MTHPSSSTPPTLAQVLRELQDDEEYWRAASTTAKTDAGLVAFGIAAGLRMALGRIAHEQG
jgi:hypothetical protein